MLIVFILLVLVVVLFALEILPPDIIVLFAIISLVLLGILTPEEAFSGFGSSLIITLISIFIIGGALKHNGVVEFLANKLALIATSSYPKIVSIVMLPAGFLSAFMSILPSLLYRCYPSKVLRRN